MKRVTRRKPPIVIDGCWIEQYAIRPRSIRFQGHRLLFRGGREVRSVPCLALGRDRDGKVMLLHCDGRWRSRVNAGDYATLREAKARAERFFPGISKHWRKTGYTARQARRHLHDGPTCTLCSKRWYDVQMVVEIKRKLMICDECIVKLHAILTESEQRRRRASEKLGTR